MFKKSSKVKGLLSRQSVAVFVITISFLLFMTSCAAGPNTMEDSQNQKGKVAGFWAGLWHGFISLFTFIISLFTDRVNVYEVHNSGNWYNFGFILGVMIFFSGSGGGACKRSRKK